MIERAATTFLDLGGTEIAALLAVIAVASFARGYSGFGFAALVVTGGSVVVAPQLLVPLISLMEIVASVLQLRGVLADIDWRRFGLLVAGSILGTPFGVAALRLLDADAMRIGLALYVVAMCALMLRGWRLSRPVGTVGIATLGLACGFLTGAVAMGGLVVATFMAADGTRPAAMRATLIAYFLPLDIYAASLFYNAGAYDRDGLTAVAIALPILAVGMAVGSRHFLRATPEQFRRYTLGLLLVLAAAAFLRSVLV